MVLLTHSSSQSSAVYPLFCGDHNNGCLAFLHWIHCVSFMQSGLCRILTQCHVPCRCRQGRLQQWEHACNGNTAAFRHPEAPHEFSRAAFHVCDDSYAGPFWKYFVESQFGGVGNVKSGVYGEFLLSAMFDAHVAERHCFAANSLQSR